MNVPMKPGGVSARLHTFTQDEASESLVRAGKLVLIFAAVALPIAWWSGGWASAGLLLVGAAISASGLWEWRRLMAALMARMEQSDAEQAFAGEPVEAPLTMPDGVRRPSIGFAVVGFTVRLAVVLVVLYVSLTYLHGSVFAIAAGLAMGVAALTVEGLRLLRKGII